MEEDAVGVTEIVKNYFTKTQYIYNFQVEKVVIVEPPDKEGKKYWDVECSFFPSLLSSTRVKYSMLIEAGTKKIYRVVKDKEA